MDDKHEPELKKLDGAEKELSEETLDVVNGGRRMLPFSRKDIEVEGDSRFDPREVKNPTRVVDL